MDDYEELGVVGKGNFGVVFLVRRKSDGARLVLKQLHNVIHHDDDINDENEDTTSMMQARREVETMTALSHENVVKMAGDVCGAFVYSALDLKGGRRIPRA